MSGEVTARPWKDSGARWMVYVPSQVMADGTRTPAERKVVTARNKTEALRWGQERREKIIHDHKAGQRGEAEARRPKAPTFAKVAEEWLNVKIVQVTTGKKKPSSIDAIKTALRVHILPFIGAKPVDRIDNAVIDALEARWVAGGYTYQGKWGQVTVKPLRSAKSRNNWMSPVNATLKFAVERKYLPAMPCNIKIPPVETAESEHYDVEVYEQLLKGALATGDPRVHVAMLLGGDAGLRRGEIVALNVEDVNFTTGIITVRRSTYWRTGDRTMLETTPKGKKPKPVASSARLLAALRELVGTRRRGRVLLDDGNTVTPKMLKVWVRHAEKAAGLPDTGRIHILRHSHVTHMADAGATLTELMSQARHSDPRVTDRYLHGRGEEAARAGQDKLERLRAGR